MSQVNFEGDVSQLSAKQIKFISNVLNDKGFQGGKAIINPVGEVGDNYVANVIRIVAEIDDKSFKIIAKVAPKLEHLRNAMNTRIMFLNEHAMYAEILPKFTEMEESAGIPEDKRLRYAACYDCLLDEYEELILLEDLTVSGFIMLDRFKPLTDNEIRLVLKSFARLHSLSYALKYKTPEVYNNLKTNLVDVWSIYQLTSVIEQAIQYFEMTETDVLSICDSKYTNSIRGTASKILEISAKLRKFDEDSRFSVIQQGDAWTNNIMFKFEENRAVSCCLIDYQVSRVNSPIADIHYMLFNCTDHETRKQNFLDWITYYYNELENNLDEYGLKINYVYPRDQLDADLKRHGKFGVAVSMILACTTSREAAAAKEFKAAMENANPDYISENMTELSINNLDDKTTNIIKSRVEGVIETCLEFGLL